MLNKENIKKINEFVYSKPRTIAEIARLLKVNWRTANRYVEKIAEEEGTVSARVFRKGTRGALKVVFWNTIEKIHASEIQKRLYKQIESGRKKWDFSPSEIFQFIDENKKELRVLTEKEYNSTDNFKHFMNFLQGAERQILFFSGNLSFSNISHNDKTVLNIVEELSKRNVTSKVLTRVEMPGLSNVKNVLAINNRVGRDIIEVRHCFHPLRATIIDDKVVALKEILDPKDYAEGELKEKLYLLYYIYDENWIEWLQKIFWNLFRSSINAEQRIKNISLKF